jgi:hypothetical protein
VFGLFAALVVLYRRLGRDTTAVIGVIVVNAVLGFVIPNVAWQAHLGGLLVGAAVAAVFALRPRVRDGVTAVSARQLMLRHVVGLVAVAAVLGVLVLGKVAVVGTSAFYPG